jgi:hypothetical protein
MISRARRRRAPSANGGTIEFAELLDPIAPPTASATVEPAKPQEPVAPAVHMVEVVEVELSEVEAVDHVETVETVEPASGPGPAASRFADAGLDDNRLPMGKPRRRWLRR